jgi:transcriptional regulator with XRE-family HTH domain
LNQRTPKRTDLQSVAIDHSATPPHRGFEVKDRACKVKTVNNKTLLFSRRAVFTASRYRQHTGLTREQFSEIIGIGDQVLGKYENGNIPIPESIFSQAAEYFKQNCSDLFNEQRFEEAQQQSQRLCKQAAFYRSKKPAYKAAYWSHKDKLVVATG